MPAAAQHPARAGVSGGAHRAAGVDGVADPQAQRAEPPVMDRPAHRARHPPLRALRCWRAGAPRHQEGRQDPTWGGWRVHGRGSERAKRANRSKRRPVGYTYLHVAIDDYSRVAYVEAHDNETAATLVGFWRRAQDWFWSNDMAVDEVMTDNGPNFVSDAFAELLAERRIVHRRTRPYRPQTNGKADRTLADEFLYNYKFRSENERRIRLKRWIHESRYAGDPPGGRGGLRRWVRWRSVRCLTGSRSVLAAS